MRGLLDREVLFFGGKGGVGKTTCASALALAASRARQASAAGVDRSGPLHRGHLRARHRARAGAGRCLRCTRWRSTRATESQRYVADVKEHIGQMFGHAILKEANRQIDLAASMPGAEEVALLDRMGTLIRGEDTRFD